MWRTTARITGILLALTAAAAVGYFLWTADQRGSATQPVRPTDSSHEAKMLAAALKQRPDHTPLRFRMAQLAQEQGRPAEAAEHLREILRHEPANAEAQLELGKVLFDMSDAAGAIEQTKSLLARQPNHADALYNLGAIYANLGNAAFAHQYWDRLIASSPQSDGARRARQMLAQLPR